MVMHLQNDVYLSMRRLRNLKKQLKIQQFFLFENKKCKRFPFDIKSPVGFSVAIIIEYAFVANLMIVPECFYTIGTTALPMLFSLANDIQYELNKIQRSLSYRRRRSKMVKPLTQFIRFHSDVRQLSNPIRN